MAVGGGFLGLDDVPLVLPSLVGGGASLQYIKDFFISDKEESEREVKGRRKGGKREALPLEMEWIRHVRRAVWSCTRFLQISSLKI